MRTTWPVKWKHKHTYLDIDTAEEITRHVAKLNYKILKTENYAEITNYARTKGTLWHTHHCRNRKLEELPFSD